MERLLPTPLSEDGSDSRASEDLNYNWRWQRKLLGWVDLTDSGWFEWGFLHGDNLTGRVLLRCSVSKKKAPRQEGWIPFLSCSILNLWQGNNIWWQKPIFPAAPDSAWPQLRPPGSSYLTLPSHHEAFYIRSLDTTAEKQDGKSPWTHKQPLHISPTHNQLALKQTYSGE